MSIESDNVVVLLVEDNPADVVFFEEAVEATRTPVTLHLADDGSEALQFLRRLGSHADAPRPDVIVLDLNLPIMSGREVAMEMASDPELNTIPVAVLTTSENEECVCDMFAKGRCLYFTKTDNFKKLQGIVREIAAHARNLESR